MIEAKEERKAIELENAYGDPPSEGLARELKSRSQTPQSKAKKNKKPK